MAYSEYLLCNADSAMMLPIGGNANIANANHPISQRLAEIGRVRFNQGSPWGVTFYHESYGGPAWSDRTITRMSGQPNYLDPMPLTRRIPQARISGNNTTSEPLRIPHRYAEHYTGGPTDNVNVVYNPANETHQLFRGFTWEHYTRSPIASSTINRPFRHRWHGVAPGDRQGPSASGVFNMFGALHGEIVAAGLNVPHALQFVTATGFGSTANDQRISLVSKQAVLPATSTDGYVQTNPYAGLGPCPYGTTITYPHGMAMPSGLSQLGQLVWLAIWGYGCYPVDGDANGVVIRADQHIPPAMVSAFVAAGDEFTLKNNLRPVLADGANPSSGPVWAWTPGLTTKGGGTPRAQNFGHGNGATPPPPSTSEPTVLNAIARRIVDD